MRGTSPPTPSETGPAQAPPGPAHQRLAWVQTTLLAGCVTAAVLIGLLGSPPLAIAIATAGAAVAGGVRVTITIRR